MTTVIAEINEKIPNAYKHPLVLNDDRLIYSIQLLNNLQMFCMKKYLRWIAMVV